MADTDESHFIGLLDAEGRHRAAPNSFSIPRSDLRRALTPGSAVKLLFGFGDGDSDGVERMWVEVVAVDGDQYVGRLENNPTVISDLKIGDQIRFGAEHVAALWREMPLAPRPEQFAVVSRRIWRDGASPVRAVRMPKIGDEFSGWFVFADDDALIPPDDLAGFEPISHHDLTNRFRSFDSIEDEPTETEWRWDDQAMEWVRDQSRR